MQNEIATFTFKKLAVRTIDKDGAVWFVADDIAKAAAYQSAYHLTRILDPDEKGNHNLVTLGGNQKVTIINESGLYHALIKSRKPEAKRFRKWVTSEVLPSIRRTGQYQLQPATPVNVGEGLRVAKLEDALLKQRPDWRAILRYLDIGLNQLEIGRLLLVSKDTVRRRLVEMSACGLIAYAPDPQRAEWARLGAAARVAKAKALADARQPSLALEG